MCVCVCVCVCGVMGDADGVAWQERDGHTQLGVRHGSGSRVASWH